MANPYADALSKSVGSGIAGLMLRHFLDTMQPTSQEDALTKLGSYSVNPGAKSLLQKELSKPEYNLARDDSTPTPVPVPTIPAPTIPVPTIPAPTIPVPTPTMPTPTTPTSVPTTPTVSTTSVPVSTTATATAQSLKASNPYADALSKSVATSTGISGGIMRNFIDSQNPTNQADALAKLETFQAPQGIKGLLQNQFAKPEYSLEGIQSLNQARDDSAAA